MRLLLSFMLLCFMYSFIKAEETICPIIADNSIAAFDSEWNENSGASKTIKIKGRENYPILKFDLSKIPIGSKIEKVELYLQLTKEKMSLRQIGFSTIPIDWEEGTNAKPEEKNHSFSCFIGSNGAEKGWGDNGYHFLNAIFGNAGNVCGSVLAVKENGKIKIILPGRVISAIQKDQPGGLTIIDESGWWGGEFSNIFFYAKENGNNKPELKVTWSKNDDTIKPSAPKISAIKKVLNDGEALLEIICGGNNNDQGQALGFDMRITEGETIDWKAAKSVDRILIPRPLESGKKIKQLLRKLKPGITYSIAIKAYDEAGNESEIQTISFVAYKNPAAPEADLEAFKPEIGEALKIENKVKICAFDEISKINPTNGKVLVGDKFEEADFFRGNLYWNGKDKAVTLNGAKGEFASFQLLLENISGAPINSISIKPEKLSSNGKDISEKNIRLLREWFVAKEGNWYTNVYPELIDKNNGVLSLPTTDNKIEGQKFLIIYAEVFIPHDTTPGNYKGTWQITADGNSVALPIQLNVANIEIPKDLSFIIELNAYGVSAKPKKTIAAGDSVAVEKYKNQKEYFFSLHRFAHFNRLGYNALGYGHSGGFSVPFIPEVSGTGKDAKIVDWNVWDEWMEPILNGSLFADLPRGAIPISHSYMPFHENYPMPVSEYLGNKIHSKRKELKDDKAFMPYMCENDVMIQDGFSQAWKDGVNVIAQEYRKHFEEKGWTKTEFQLFCNNKVFKGKENATSLWTLDEPSYGRDFYAISYLCGAFLKPFNGSKLKIETRADVSRPESQGNRLDNTVTLFVTGVFGREQQFIQKRMQEQNEKYWIYGGGGKMGADTDMCQLVAAYIKMWTQGCVGGLVHWTSFSGSTWDEINPMAIVLKGEQGYSQKPTASDRLIAMRRAQMDIELLNLLSQKPGWSRYSVVNYVNKIVKLDSTSYSENAEDPGEIKFTAVKAEQLIKLRLSVLKELSK